MQVGKSNYNIKFFSSFLLVSIIVLFPFKKSYAQGNICVNEYKKMSEQFEDTYTNSNYYLLQESYYTQNGSDGKVTEVEVINKANEIVLISDYLSIYRNDDFAITISHLEKKAIIKPYNKEDTVNRKTKAVLPYEDLVKVGITPTCQSNNHIELLFSDSVFNVTGVKKIAYVTNKENRVLKMDKYYRQYGYDMVEHTFYKTYIPEIGDKKYVFTQFKNEVIKNIIAGKYLDYSITDLR
ncbi:MAG: hypothetical protein CL843_14465 [Crocinitomicaceae bacterium]|nr:hypothetical protein [Crocinitomicaceae bacterium]|tara:strand:+ start:4051 stop:4764 length:714 start_codon:yes stop_codon:yes gene_type:complete